MAVGIIVETLTGETIDMEVEASDTIEQVQAKIQERTNMPPDRFCFVAKPLCERTPRS